MLWIPLNLFLTIRIRLSQVIPICCLEGWFSATKDRSRTGFPGQAAGREGERRMGDLSVIGIGKADAQETRIAPEGEILPPRPGEAAIDRPARAGKGIPFAHFQPGDPLYAMAQQALGYLQAAQSPATARAYDSDFRLFAAWCGQVSLKPLPATTSTIGLYLTHLAEKGQKVATIARKLAAISSWHQANDLASPCSMKADRQLAALYAGIRRTQGTKQSAKAAITVDLLKRMLDNVEGPLTAARDRALLLIGFAGGLRRSEIAGIHIEHLRSHAHGFTITLPTSKTDQEGQGREVEIVRSSQPQEMPLGESTCPVRALDQWIRQANIQSGPVFRKVTRGENVQKTGLNPASVAWILKRALDRAGIRNLGRFSAHSLRAGFATTAYENGVPEFKIRQQTGHRSARMLEKYIRSNEKARRDAAGNLGL